MLHTKWECKTGQLLWKQSGSFKKLNMELPCDPAILLLGIDPREMKIYVHAITYRNIYSSIIHINQKIERA